MQINYRYQLSFESADRPAIAPRATIILPTGDETGGLGSGSTGMQLNLPVSKIISDDVTLHGNAGVTRYFDIRMRSPTSINLGGSIIYAASKDFNFMLEAVEEWNESVSPTGKVESDATFTLSPGFRAAVNLDSGAQIVVGAAVPVRIDNSETDLGAFLYFSVEH